MGNHVTSARMDQLEDRRLLSAGGIDPYFGSGGAVTIAADGVAARSYDFQPLADGRILVAFGVPHQTTDGMLAAGIRIQRFNSDGRIDTRFATSTGSDQPGIFINQSDHVPSVHLTLRPHGGFLVRADFTLYAFADDGALDSSFGEAGHIDLKAKILPSDIGIRSDGSILIAGTTTRNGDSRFAIGALERDGHFDPDFGTDGVLTLPIADVGFFAQPDRLESRGASVVIAPDDSAFVVGGFEYYESQVEDIDGFPDFVTYADRGLIVAHINPDHSFDANFGPNGIRQTDAIDPALHLGDGGTGRFDEADGVPIRIFSAGRNGNLIVFADDNVDLRVLTVHADGSVSKLFHPTIDDDEWFDADAESFTALADGSALLGVTHTERGARFELHHLRPDGSFDASFDSAAAAALFPSKFESTSSSNTRIAADGTFLMLASVSGLNSGDPSSLSLHRFWRSNAPAAEANTVEITTSTTGSQVLTVTYRDDTRVDRRSFNNRDLRITGPGGFVAYAKFERVTKSRNGDGWVRARYKLPARGGRWDSADNGTYSIRLRGDQVLDTEGHAAATRTIGTFLVNISEMRVFASPISTNARALRQPAGDEWIIPDQLV